MNMKMISAKKILPGLLAITTVMNVLTAQAAEPVMRCGAGMKMDTNSDTSSDMNMEGDHDMSMDMQGGSAPADARDPHAFADGYTHDETYPLELADKKYFGMLMFDRLERVDTTDPFTAFDMHAWIGRDYDKLVVMAEGDVANGKLGESMSGVYWQHAVATFWDTQLGVRHDGGMEENRDWLGFGIQGLAPYWFEIRAMAYVGENGRTALVFAADYEMLFTQKIILQPAIEINAYGKPDPINHLGTGVTDVAAGLRLRYEFTRQFAPYVGVEWTKLYGTTADNVQAMNESTSDTHWVAGLRFWF
jgi:copper resistance protein B